MANNCRIFTPTEYVNELLDTIGYKGQLYGKSILENSCGDGKILVEVVRRYIVSCKRKKMTNKEIKNGLEHDVYGVELEKAHAVSCRKNLDDIANSLGVKDVAWNIIEGDYLRLQLNRKFTYIVGNPPYITYKDIEIPDRVYLKNSFISCCDGKFDYYYAFVEKSVKELEKNGKMAYIIPYSIYKNVFGYNLREYIKPYLQKVVDYTYKNKFPGITTSSTMLLLQNKKTKQFIYVDVVNGKQLTIKKNELGKKWEFTESEISSGKYRFGDYFQVNNTIATLYNKAFLIENFTRDDRYYNLSNGDKVEIGVVKKAVSKKRGAAAYNIAIIFPYYFENNELKHYTESEFEKKFPYATAHLMNYKEELKKRAADKNALWFEYGRSQALTKICEEKLVMPSITSSRINVTLEEKDVILCAGYFVTKNGKYSLQQAKNILESPRFYEYLKQIGIFTTGKSRRLSVNDIANYRFENWE